MCLHGNADLDQPADIALTVRNFRYHYRSKLLDPVGALNFPPVCRTAGKFDAGRYLLRTEVEMIAILVVAAVIAAGVASGLPTSPDEPVCNGAITECNTAQGAGS
jgi:hypothetical protein